MGLGLGRALGYAAPPSRFNEDDIPDTEVPFAVPLLSEVEDLMQETLTNPTAKLVFTPTTRWMFAMQDKENVGRGSLR